MGFDSDRYFGEPLSEKIPAVRETGKACKRNERELRQWEGAGMEDKLGYLVGAFLHCSLSIYIYYREGRG